MDKDQQSQLAKSLALSFEEAHYFGVVAAFCEILTDVVTNDTEDGRKQALLMASLQEFLPVEVYDNLFGEKF